GRDSRARPAQRRDRRLELSRYGHDRTRPHRRVDRPGHDARASAGRAADSRLRRRLRCGRRLDGKPVRGGGLPRLERGRSMSARRQRAAAVAALAIGFALQGPVALGQPPPTPPEQQSARERAPIDLTGQWVAVVNEDWRWRMVTPPVGDTASIPLNARGREVAEAWDLERDR